MKKPEHRWETRLHRAVRIDDAPGPRWADDPRAEVFELRFFDGRRGRAVLGLRRQEIERACTGDPDLVHAVRCWLVARGARRTRIYDDGGRLLERASLQVAELGDEALPEPPRRLVTLAPSNAEMVHALGAFDSVLACEDSSDFPPAVRSLPRLGPDLGPDLDAVAALQPDLVVSSLSVPGMERVVTGLRARGLPQIVLAPRSLDEVLAEVQRLGRVLQRSTQAEAVVQDMQRQRDELRRARRDPPARVYLEWWPRPMYTPGSDCYSNELIALAGGVNVFGDRPGSSVRIEPGELVQARPEVCFVSWCGVAEAKLDPDNLIRRPGLEQLEAARAGRVFALDEAYAGRPGPRMLEAARRMAAAIAQSRSGP